MNKYNDKYRIDSARLKNWDYSWKGLYFVTINTQNHLNYFGEIIESQMVFSDIGNYVHEQWQKTAGIRPDMNLILDEFQVMPNHFHGIIGIGRNQFNKYENHRLTFSEIQNIDFSEISTQKQIGPQSKNLGSVIRGFKSSVTSFTRKNKLLFDWHPRFHDSLIRNELSLNKVRWYIRNNVKNWHRDRFK